MKMYKREQSQLIETDIENCWAFFSNPRNLEKFKPDEMLFEIQDYDNKLMYEGQIITYLIAPILKIKLKWVTEITTVKENEFFIDEQRFGPYQFWHHKHFFEQTPQGIQMTDVVHYAMPFGFIGRLVHYFLVKKQLDNIFNQRYKRINEIFKK